MSQPDDCQSGPDHRPLAPWCQPGNAGVKLRSPVPDPSPPPWWMPDGPLPDFYAPIRVSNWQRGG